MSLNRVTVTWDENDPTLAGLTGTVTFTLSTVLSDATDGLIIHPVPQSYSLSQGASQPLVANDNSAVLPTGSFYTITMQPDRGGFYSFQAFINFSNGATQKLSSLVPITTQPSMLAYLPLPTGTPQAGQVPVATGSGEVSAWGTIGGGLQLMATTSVSGYTMINGSGTIASWTAPNDGNLHQAVFSVRLNVTSNETGGQLAYDIGGNPNNLIAPNVGSGVYFAIAAGPVLPGEIAKVEQFSPLTAGAATVWAQIWGA